MLEIWTAKAWLRSRKEAHEQKKDEELIKIGRKLLSGPEDKVRDLEVTGEDMERSSRKVVIIKAYQAYHAYRNMILYYGVKNTADYIKNDSKSGFTSIKKLLQGERETSWVNFGGQLIPEKDTNQLRADIGSGRLASWGAIHERYNQLWKNYQFEKAKHAYASLCAVLCTADLSTEQWLHALDESVKVQEYVNDQVYKSRKKDYDNKFFQSTFRNKDEMNASLGFIEDNSFIKQVKQETIDYKNMIAEIRMRV